MLNKLKRGKPTAKLCNVCVALCGICTPASRRVWHICTPLRNVFVAFSGPERRSAYVQCTPLRTHVWSIARNRVTLDVLALKKMPSQTLVCRQIIKSTESRASATRVLVFFFLYLYISFVCPLNPMQVRNSVKVRKRGLVTPTQLNTNVYCKELQRPRSESKKDEVKVGVRGSGHRSM